MHAELARVAGLIRQAADASTRDDDRGSVWVRFPEDAWDELRSFARRQEDGPVTIGEGVQGAAARIRGEFIAWADEYVVGKSLTDGMTFAAMLAGFERIAARILPGYYVSLLNPRLTADGRGFESDGLILAPGQGMETCSESA